MWPPKIYFRWTSASSCFSSFLKPANLFSLWGISRPPSKAPCSVWCEKHKHRQKVHVISKQTYWLSLFSRIANLRMNCLLRTSKQTHLNTNQPLSCLPKRVFHRHKMKLMWDRPFWTFAHHSVNPKRISLFSEKPYKGEKHKHIKQCLEKDFISWKC